MRLRVDEANYLMCNVVAKIKSSLFLVYPILKIQRPIQKNTPPKSEGEFMLLKLKQFALALLLINSAALANDITQLDGDWYSFKWKYGYSLSNGKGVAFASNSPNFKVGQEIVRLTAVGKNSFVGENVFKDGKFHKVKATLDQDGKLLFEGEKNVKWEMEKIDPETYSSIVNSKPEKQAKKKDTEMSGAGSGNDSQREIGTCIGFISKTIDVNGVENVDSRYMKYLKKNNKLVTDVINTTRNYPQCFEAGVIISDCLQAKKVSSKTIGLMMGYNTGLTNYNDSVSKAVMSAACVEL
jgi:hypothetical protein